MTFMIENCALLVYEILMVNGLSFHKLSRGDLDTIGSKIVIVQNNSTENNNCCLIVCNYIKLTCIKRHISSLKSINFKVSAVDDFSL